MTRVLDFWELAHPARGDRHSHLIWRLLTSEGGKHHKHRPAMGGTVREVHQAVRNTAGMPSAHPDRTAGPRSEQPAREYSEQTNRPRQPSASHLGVIDHQARSNDAKGRVDGFGRRRVRTPGPGPLTRQSIAEAVISRRYRRDPDSWRRPPKDVPADGLRKHYNDQREASSEPGEFAPLDTSCARRLTPEHGDHFRLTNMAPARDAQRMTDRKDQGRHAAFQTAFRRSRNTSKTAMATATRESSVVVSMTNGPNGLPP